jgi:tetratricopeptide (TPR) repeat protein
LEEAKDNLVAAIRIVPDYVAAHYDLGALLVQLGDAPRGIEHLQRTTSLQPDHADAHYNLAVALAMMGRRNEAIGEIEKAQALNPKDEQTRRFRSYLLGIDEAPSTVQEFAAPR